MQPHSIVVNSHLELASGCPADLALCVQRAASREPSPATSLVLQSLWLPRPYQKEISRDDWPRTEEDNEIYFSLIDRLYRGTRQNLRKWAIYMRYCLVLTLITLAWTESSALVLLSLVLEFNSVYSAEYTQRHVNTTMTARCAETYIEIKLKLNHMKQTLIFQLCTKSSESKNKYVCHTKLYCRVLNYKFRKDISNFPLV